MLQYLMTPRGTTSSISDCNLDHLLFILAQCLHPSQGKSDKSEYQWIDQIGGDTSFSLKKQQQQRR